MEKPYYTCKNLQKVCIKCGKSKNLMIDNPTYYPLCEKCPKDRVKIAKRKKVAIDDFPVKKKQKLSYKGS